jgi:hypothetical protein
MRSWLIGWPAEAIRTMTMMIAGIVFLGELYDFVEKHRKNEDALRIERTEIGKEYSALCHKITDSVAEYQGFYLYGRYDRRRYWRSIYLGIAKDTAKKNSLRKRILEELKDERAFIWRHVFSEQKLEGICQVIHQGKYSWRRPMLKAHTTEIVWASFPGLEGRDVRSIEADLIEALNPTANLVRPTPTKVPQPEATRVFEEFRKTIHSARPTKPSSLHLAVDETLRASKSR